MIDINKCFLRRVELNEISRSLAYDFVLKKWKERAAERGESEPQDLSWSCKFSSLFCQRVFGGHLAGNYDHIFNMIDGNIFDLNANADDVKLLDDPYEDDFEFLNSEDFLASLESCIGRVNIWVKEFIYLAKENNLTIQASFTQTPKP